MEVNVVNIYNIEGSKCCLLCFGLRECQMPTRLYYKGRQLSKNGHFTHSPTEAPMAGISWKGSRFQIPVFLSCYLWAILQSQPGVGSLKFASSLAREAASAAPSLAPLDGCDNVL